MRNLKTKTTNSIPVRFKLCNQIVFTSFNALQMFISCGIRDRARKGTLGSLPSSLLAPMLLLYSILKWDYVLQGLKPKQIVFEIPNQTLK